MIAFRDRKMTELGLQLLVHTNQEGAAEGVGPFTHGSAYHTDVMKTVALKQALDKYGFDAAFGGARRDEEKSRAKERIISVRTAGHRWDPKRQRPELWNLYNTRLQKGESLRAFPISNWTELDVWNYIKEEKMEIPSIYYSHQRQVIERDGMLWADSDYLNKEADEIPFEATVRFRTVGDMTCTAAVASDATDIDVIIEEILSAEISERGARIDDKRSEAAMEKRKQQGYF
jgi:sulfate adenylyltransferase subunit 2